RRRLVALVRQHASWMILCLDVLLLVSTPSPLLSPIVGRLRICFPSSDTPGPWRLVSKRAVPRNASYRAGYIDGQVGLCQPIHYRQAHLRDRVRAPRMKIAQLTSPAPTRTY